MSNMPIKSSATNEFAYLIASAALTFLAPATYFHKKPGGSTLFVLGIIAAEIVLIATGLLLGMQWLEKRGRSLFGLLAILFGAALTCLVLLNEFSWL